MTDLTKLQEIARLRKSVSQQKEEAAALFEKAQQTPEYQAYLKAEEERQVDAGLLGDAEHIYRDDCLAEYNQTGEKKLPGGQIKIYTSLEYDEQIAVDWCLAHEHGKLLKLDSRGFEKVAKELEPDFVTTIETPKMTLASDLSEFE